MKSMRLSTLLTAPAVFTAGLHPRLKFETIRLEKELTIRQYSNKVIIN